MLNSSLLNINYGLIKSNGSKATANVLASSIIIQLILQVSNDPLNVYGIQDNIIVTAGQSSMQIPFAVTGPVLYPVLSVQKSVKVSILYIYSFSYHFQTTIEFSSQNYVQQTSYYVI